MTVVGTNSWQGIEAEVVRRINERIWLPGDRLPSEADLAAEFGCARATVNRAMRKVADAGLIERKRKAGTVVRQNPVRKATLEIPVIRLEVERQGHAYRHMLLEKKSMRPPVPVLGAMALPADCRLLHLRALHFAGERPYAHEVRWINQQAAPSIGKADLEQISANEWLVQNAPFTRGSFAISATSAGPDEVELLAAPPGAALLTVDRTTWNGSVAITTVRLTYAAGHRMTTTV